MSLELTPVQTVACCHLKVLHEIGLLDRSKRGVWVYYKVRTEALVSLGTLIGGAGA